MAVIILPVSFSALLLCFAGTGRYGLRQSFVYAATVYTLCLVVATELLSVWNILVFEVLLLFWMGLTIVSGIYLYFYSDWNTVHRTFNGSWLQFCASKALWAVALVWSIVLAIAIVYPPINWDSMVYHMPRVAMWAQQGSIDHFPTTVLRQLFNPPLAEWNILHFQILSGSDRFANVVQWLALVGCSIAASLITRELKQSLKVQVLALVIAVTLPMGLLQGSSTQNDLVVAFWLLTFALFAMQYIRKPTAAHMSFCGLALGFALLTKGTAYVYAPPLATALLLYGIIHATAARPRLKLLSAAAVVIALTLLLNNGHWARNWSLFGNPWSTGDYEYRNAEVSIAVTWSNLVRNAALHLGVPSDRINAVTSEIVRGILGPLIDDPTATLQGSFALRIAFSKHEDYAGNFLHFWALNIAFAAILLFNRILNFDRIIVFYAVAVILSVLFYNSILTWQIWGSRLHSPLFMLGVPVAAIFVSSLGSRIAKHCAKIFLIMSVPWIIFNQTRPIYSENGQSLFSVDRITAYFRPLPNLFQGYDGAVEYLEAYKPEEVGIKIDGYRYVYPLRVLMRQKLKNAPKLAHFEVGNVSAKLRDGSYYPPYLISTTTPVENLERVPYTVVWVSPPVKDPATQVFVSARLDMVGDRRG